jgi:citrate lyase subunit beta/citryl-CoA lyase
MAKAEMSSVSHLRSFLFVPGSRPDRFDKALRSAAGQVILDLEDAVAPAEKDAARQNVAQWRDRTGAVVRLNGAETPHFEADIGLVRNSGVSRVMLPKATPAVVARFRQLVGRDCEIIALVETVEGFFGLKELARSGQISCFAFGNLDFGIDAGITETGRQLDPVRLQIVLESRLAGLPAPIDGVTTSWDDEAAFTREVQYAKALGFGAKLCIHPAQVKLANEAFRPTAEEVNWARRVMKATAGGHAGAVALDGKMIDAPVIRRAQTILRDTAIDDA